MLISHTRPEAPAFETTYWSVVLAAGDADSQQAGEAMEKLCRAYWYPLYLYVRRRGYEAPDAQDLTQEFFSRFIGKNFLASVDPQKGKFRSFLLASLKHFLSVARVRDSAIKRGGRQTFIPLDDAGVEDRYLAEPPSNLPPEAVYDRGWATTLMEQALARVREEFQREGKAGQFERLKMFLSREPREGEYAAVAAESQTTPGAISVAVHRLRHRYGEQVRTEVANTVAQPSDVDAELRYLFATLTAD
jgi:DNA-directed RNA polymerase specialized sigma24 family protein